MGGEVGRMEDGVEVRVRGGEGRGWMEMRVCICFQFDLYFLRWSVSALCVGVCGTGGLKRLNPSLATVTEKTPPWSARAAGRLLQWRPICMAPCPVRGISLFFPRPPSLLLSTLERLLQSSGTARCRGRQWRGVFRTLGRVCMLEGMGTRAAK